MGEQVLRLDEIKAFRLLVAVDGSEGSRKALRKAFDMAKENLAYDLLVIYVIEVREPSTMVSEMGEDVKERMARELIEDAKEQAESEDITIRTEVLRGHPAQSVLDFAETFRPDMIFVGSTGTNIARAGAIGSVASAISKKAKHPVLVVR